MKLAEIRERQGLTQAQLAEKVGVSQPTIQRAETMDKTARLATYIACAKALGVTLPELFSDLTQEETELLAMFRKVPQSQHEAVRVLLAAVRQAVPEAPASAARAEAG